MNEREEADCLNQLAVGQSATVCCPHCEASLLTLTHDDLNTPTKEPWLEDGDTVPGADSEVDAAGYGGGHATALMVGCCPHCKGSYWVAEAILLDGDWDTVEEYLSGMAPFGEVEALKHYVAAGGAPGNLPRDLEPFRGGEELRAPRGSWWMLERVYASGPIHEHTFGPFALHDTGALRGPHGVAACGDLAKAPAWSQARALLLTVWPALAARHAAALSRTGAATRSQRPTRTAP